MDYRELTREQLLERIEELELLNTELLNEKEQEVRLEYAWTGNLGHWYWNVKTNSVTFNPLKITTLGYDKNDLPSHVTYQFFTDKLHPEDYQKTMDAMMQHLYGEADVYEVEYRILAKDGTYKWFYDRGKITQYDNNGKPLFLAGIVFNITDKKEQEIKLEYRNKILAEQASTDGLTKIGNHRAIIEQLKSEIADANKRKCSFSIAIFDIDDFKNVNDSKGHIYGDMVLSDMGVIIKKNIRNSDFVGRYGGEEFMVIFPNTELDKAANISERIRQAVENYHFVEDIHITISGGVKEYKGERISELIHSADINLYDAKGKGKNRIVF